MSSCTSSLVCSLQSHQAEPAEARAALPCNPRGQRADLSAELSQCAQSVPSEPGLLADPAGEAVPCMLAKGSSSPDEGEKQCQAADNVACRICMESEPCADLFRPCLCRGTMKFVHKECLQHWRSMASNRQSYYRCDQCHYQYNIRRVDAVGILKLPGMALFMTLCALAIGFVFCTLVAAILVGKSPRNREILFTGAALFGLFSFFALCFTEGGHFCRRGCDFLTRLMHEFPMGRHGGSLDNLVALFIVAVVAVMVAMGLLMAPYFIYRLVIHVSTVGMQALETYVLDIGAADPTVVDEGASSKSSAEARHEVDHCLAQLSNSLQGSPDASAQAGDSSAGISEERSPSTKEAHLDMLCVGLNNGARSNPVTSETVSLDTRSPGKELSTSVGQCLDDRDDSSEGSHEQIESEGPSGAAEWERLNDQLLRQEILFAQLQHNQRQNLHGDSPEPELNLSQPQLHSPSTKELLHADGTLPGQEPQGALSYELSPRKEFSTEEGDRESLDEEVAWSWSDGLSPERKESLTCSCAKRRSEQQLDGDVGEAGPEVFCMECAGADLPLHESPLQASHPGCLDLGGLMLPKAEQELPALNFSSAERTCEERSRVHPGQQLFDLDRAAWLECLAAEIGWRACIVVP